MLLNNCRTSIQHLHVVSKLFFITAGTKQKERAILFVFSRRSFAGGLSGRLPELCTLRMHSEWLSSLKQPHRRVQRWHKKRAGKEARKKKKRDHWVIVCEFSWNRPVCVHAVRKGTWPSLRVYFHPLCFVSTTLSAECSEDKLLLMSTRHMRLWFVKTPPHPSTFV